MFEIWIAERMWSWRNQDGDVPKHWVCVTAIKSLNVHEKCTNYVDDDSVLSRMRNWTASPLALQQCYKTCLFSRAKKIFLSKTMLRSYVGVSWERLRDSLLNRQRAGAARPRISCTCCGARIVPFSRTRTGADRPPPWTNNLILTVTVTTTRKKNTWSSKFTRFAGGAGATYRLHARFRPPPRQRVLGTRTRTTSGRRSIRLLKFRKIVCRVSWRYPPLTTPGKRTLLSLARLEQKAVRLEHAQHFLRLGATPARASVTITHCFLFEIDSKTNRNMQNIAGKEFNCQLGRRTAGWSKLIFVGQRVKLTLLP